MTRTNIAVFQAYLLSMSPLRPAKESLEIVDTVGGEDDDDDDTLDLDSVSLLDDFMEYSQDERRGRGKIVPNGGQMVPVYMRNIPLASLTIRRQHEAVDDNLSEGKPDQPDNKTTCRLWTRGLDQSFKVNVSLFTSMNSFPIGGAVTWFFFFFKSTTFLFLTPPLFFVVLRKSFNMVVVHFF